VGDFREVGGQCYLTCRERVAVQLCGAESKPVSTDVAEKILRSLAARGKPEARRFPRLITRSGQAIMSPR